MSLLQYCNNHHQSSQHHHHLSHLEFLPSCVEQTFRILRYILHTVASYHKTSNRSMDMEQQVHAPVAQAQKASQQPFGLIMPGKNVITNFIPDATGTKFTLELPFPLSPSASMDTAQSQTSSSESGSGSQSELPTSVHDIVFFLLPNTPLPPNMGAVLYWSASIINAPESSSGFELLGALTPNQTSTILRTGWGTHDPLLKLVAQCQSHMNTSMNNGMGMGMNMGINMYGIKVTLGVSLEPLSNISNLQIDQFQSAENRIEDKKNVAKKIATDLFNYLQSFDDVGNGNGNTKSGWMTVPVNVFERWCIN